MPSPETDEIFTTWTSEADDVDASVVFLCGELDASSSPSFLAELQDVVNRRRHVVMDVHLLSYVDSTGVAAILSIRSSIESFGRSLCLVGCHGLIDKLLHSMGVRSHLACYDDIDQAMADLKEQRAANG